MNTQEMLNLLLNGAMIVLGILAFFSLIRCILGPRISDRVMAVNILGTLTIIMVAVLAVRLGEGYLADVGLVYAMISFLSVCVLCKVFTGLYRERKHNENLAEKEGGN